MHDGQFQLLNECQPVRHLDDWRSALVAKCPDSVFNVVGIWLAIRLINHERPNLPFRFDRSLFLRAIVVTRLINLLMVAGPFRFQQLRSGLYLSLMACACS